MIAPFGVSVAVEWYRRGILDVGRPSTEKRAPGGAAGSYRTGVKAGLSASDSPTGSKTCPGVRQMSILRSARTYRSVAGDATLGAVNNKDAAVGEKDGVEHEAGLRHALDRPPGGDARAVEHHTDALRGRACL